MVSEKAETCRFINTTLYLPKLVVLDFFTPYLIGTHTTGMPQLKIPEEDTKVSKHVAVIII
jgi:hypothetical protein